MKTWGIPRCGRRWSDGVSLRADVTAGYLKWDFFTGYRNPEYFAKIF